MRTITLTSVIVALLVCTTSAHASGYLRLSADEGGYACELSDPGPGAVVFVYVYLSTFPNGTRGVRFSAPLPPGSGLTYLGSTTGGFSDPESGYDIAFEYCYVNGVVLEMILQKTSSGSPCTLWRLAPYPGDSDIVYTDCQGQSHIAMHGTGLALNSNGDCNLAFPPYNPSPPTGATDVPLLTQLEWSFDNPDCGDISGRIDEIDFGTTPNPPPREQYIYSPYKVGPLTPATTYYWKVLVRAYGSIGVSPIWSFTTAATVAVRPSTWGAIKALYR